MLSDSNWFQLRGFLESHVSSLPNHPQCTALPGSYLSFSWTLSTLCDCNVLWQGVPQLCYPLHEKKHFPFFALNLHPTCLCWWSLLSLEDMRNCPLLSLLFLILMSMYTILYILCILYPPFPKLCLSHAEVSQAIWIFHTQKPFHTLFHLLCLSLKIVTEWSCIWLDKWSDHNLIFAHFM